MQYLLDKDSTSPVKVEADCPQQHPDACGTWRRVELEYADGCKIILDGEDKDKNVPVEQKKSAVFKKAILLEKNPDTVSIILRIKEGL